MNRKFFPTVALDVDGVVANLTEVFFMAVRELKESENWHDVDLGLLKPSNIENFDWKGIGLYSNGNKKARLKKVWELINQENLWDKAKPYSGAESVIRNWLQIGFHIVYITQRPDEKQIKNWLTTRELVIDESDVHVTKDVDEKTSVLKHLIKQSDQILYFDDYWPNIEGVMNSSISKDISSFFVLHPWAREFGITGELNTLELGDTKIAMPVWDGSFLSIPYRVSELLAKSFL